MFLRISKNYFFKISFLKFSYILNFFNSYFISFIFFFNFFYFFKKINFNFYPFCLGQFIYIVNIFNYFSKLLIYKYEFLLDGLYYRVKYYKQYNILGFIIGYSTYFYYKLPLFIYCFVHKKKRRFFLYSMDIVLLTNIMIEIVNLKYPNLFKSKGIKYVEYIYRKKDVQEKKNK